MYQIKTHNLFWVLGFCIFLNSNTVYGGWFCKFWECCGLKDGIISPRGQHQEASVDASVVSMASQVADYRDGQSSTVASAPVYFINGFQTESEVSTEAHVPEYAAFQDVNPDDHELGGSLTSVVEDDEFYAVHAAVNNPRVEGIVHRVISGVGSEQSQRSRRERRFSNRSYLGDQYLEFIASIRGVIDGARTYLFERNRSIFSLRSQDSLEQHSEITFVVPVRTIQRERTFLMGDGGSTPFPHVLAEREMVLRHQILPYYRLDQPNDRFEHIDGGEWLQSQEADAFEGRHLGERSESVEDLSIRSNRTLGVRYENYGGTQDFYSLSSSESLPIPGINIISASASAASSVFRGDSLRVSPVAASPSASRTFSASVLPDVS